MRIRLALSILLISSLLLSDGCTTPGDKYDIKFVLSVDEAEFIRDLAGYDSDTVFVKAIALARQKQASSQEDYITLFGEAFSEIDSEAVLAAIFATREMAGLIDFNSTNDEVLKIITDEYQKSIENTRDVLLQRMDNLGIKKKNREFEIADNKIHITIKSLSEDNGDRMAARISKLLTTRGQIEFWETYENSEIFPYLQNANEILRETFEKEDSTIDNTEDLTLGQFINENPLLGILQPNTSRQGSFIPGAGVGLVYFNDREKVDEYLQYEQVKKILPRDIRFLWEMNPFDDKGEYYMLYAIRVTGRDYRAPLNGSVITNVSAESDKSTGRAIISMKMNSEGARIWSRLTRENIDKAIAIVFDGNVVSAPTVSEEIPNGSSTISGNFTYAEAVDLANILNSMGGRKLPGKLRIEKSHIINPE